MKIRQELRQLHLIDIRDRLKNKKPIYWLFWFSVPGKSKNSGKRQVMIQDSIFPFQIPSGVIDQYAFESLDDLQIADHILWKNWNSLSNYAVAKEIRRINWEMNQ